MWMPSRRATLAVAVLLVACSSGDSGDAGAPADDAMAAADAAYGEAMETFRSRSGRADTDEAIAGFEQAVSLNPDHAPAWAALSTARLWLQFNLGEQGMVAPAQEALDRAVGLAPDAVETHLAQGYMAYWGQLDLDAALAHFQAAEAMAPNDAAVHGALGNVYRRQAKVDDALGHYERRVELNPSGSQGLITLIQTYNIVGRYADAAPYVDQLKANGDWRGHAWDFWTHLNGGDTASAFAAVEPIRGNFDGEPVFFDLTRAVIRRDADGTEALIDTIGVDVPTGWWWTFAEHWSRTGQIQEHADVVEGWIQNRLSRAERSGLSEDARTSQQSLRHAQAAQFEALRGNEDAAREHIARSLEAQPNVTDRWAAAGHLDGVGWAYLHLGDLDAAMETFMEVAEQGRGSSTGWMEHHPAFDPLRSHPGYAALVEMRRGFETPR